MEIGGRRLKKIISGIAQTLFCAAIVLSLVLVSALHQSSTTGNNWSVDWRPGATNFTSIQAALSDSGVYDGDTITVHWPPNSVAYNESVLVNKSVTITGYSPEGTPVIDGGGKPVFNVTASSVTLFNLAIRNGSYGVYLSPTASGANIAGDSIMNNSQYGIYVGSSSNLIENNNLTGNHQFGIDILADTNALRGNNMTNNTYNFGMSNFLNNNIDPSNTVDGKPIYVWTGKDSVAIPPGAGYVAIINSNNVTVKDLPPLTHNDAGITLINTTNSAISNVLLSQNKNYGIYINSSNNITVENAKATFNGDGISINTSQNIIIENANASFNGNGIRLQSVYDSQIINSSMLTQPNADIFMSNTGNNTIAENIIENSFIGVWDDQGNGNSFFHNDFKNNTSHTHVTDSHDQWDNGMEGNYWSGLVGTDANQDGIWDRDLSNVPYKVYDDNRDNLDWNPLVCEWTLTRQFPVGNYTKLHGPAFEGYKVTIQNNHVVGGFDQHWQAGSAYPRVLSFNLTAATDGYCNITIPRAWLDGPFNLTLNNVPKEFTSPPANVNETYLSFNYPAGQFHVEISGTKTGAIPGDVSGSTPGVPDGIVNMKDVGYVARQLDI